MTGKKLAVFASVTVLAASGLTQDLTPAQVFAKVTAAYQAKTTYKAQGTISSNVEMGQTKTTMETSFSILLKKPNLYLISWTQRHVLPAALAQAGAPAMTQAGTVWSDGTQPYLYMGFMNAYAKMNSDQMALSAATGISGGAAHTIPALFLSTFSPGAAGFARLTDPKLEGTETVADDECYVIGSPSAASRKETYWISKSTFLIRKFARSLEPPAGGRQMPEMTDAQLDEAIKGMGQKVTDETRKNMRDLMAKTKETMKTANVKGDSVELHTDISSPELKAADFQFKPPEGAVLKDSLFGGVIGGRK